MEESLRPISFQVQERTNPNPRKITLEEVIARQIDRIAYQRSVGEDWSESVFALRDMIHGLEDEEFWTGLTPKDEETMGKVSPATLRYLKEKRASQGWNGMPINRTSNGDWHPTAEQLSNAYRIIMKLLARRGLTWRNRNTSKIERMEP